VATAVDFAVLGCGWAGVLLSLKLKERFPSASLICLEASSSPGGLLRTEVVEGFTFDIGGSHIIFSRDESLLREMLGFAGEVVSHERLSFILYDGHKIPYPFENGIYALPPERRAELLVGFVEALLENAKSERKPRNLKEWAEWFFGSGIAGEYLIPYNEKIWKRGAEQIAADWLYTPGRLPWPDWRDVVRSGAGVPTTGYREQARFYYPLSGGIQRLFDGAAAAAEKLGARVIRGFRVERLEKRDRWIINGEIEAKRVFSTLPLSSLPGILELPGDVERAASSLQYNRVVVVGVALRKEAPREHWVYVPQRDYVFHRYAWVSNYSPLNAPRGCSSLIAEVTVEPWRSLRVEEVVEETMDGLKQLGVVSEAEEEVLFTRAWVHEHGYPVYTHGHAETRGKVLSYLEELGVVSVGRWGSWHYWNMDRVLAEVNRLTASLSPG